MLFCINALMKELLRNAEEFLQSGEDNIKKERFNAAVSDFFKAIVIICDYLIYNEIKSLPKNHNERFAFLKTYFSEIYEKVSGFFKTYTDSYNLKLNRDDSEKLKSYAYELKNFASNKK